MCEAQNAVNPVGFTSILTKSQHKILVSKSDSSLNALAKVDLKKGELTVSYAEDVDDDLIKNRIQKAGYSVTAVK